MSKVKIALTYALCLGVCQAFAPAIAQNCALSGVPSWSESLKTVLADCDNRIVSPNGLLVLRIDATGAVQVLEQSGHKLLAQAAQGVEPPASASWSPNSDAFFINDGEGSGETSELRLYFVKDGKITELKGVQRRVASLYRRRIKCAHDALDPDVWGLRWTPDGQYVDLLVEATIHQPCGQSGSFRGMRVRARDAKVMEVLSEEATVARWSAWLPQELKIREDQSTP